MADNATRSSLTSLPYDAVDDPEATILATLFTILCVPLPHLPYESMALVYL
jgi:hypothetical protein